MEFKREKPLMPFLRLFGGHLKWMILGTLCGLLAVASAVGLLALSGWFISAAAYAGLTAATAQMFNFFYPGIGVRFFAISRTLARYAERIITHDATFRILQTLRTWFYRRLEPLAPFPAITFRSGDMLSRIVSDIDALDNLYLRVIAPTVTAAIVSLLVIIFLWLFNPFISMVTALFLLLAGVGVPLLALRLGEDCGRQLNRNITDLRIRIVDILQGLPDLLVFGAHQRHLETARHSSRALLKRQLRMSHIRGLSLALTTLLSGLTVLSVLYLAVARAGGTTLNGPDLTMVALTVLASFEAVLPLPIAYQYLGHTREAGRRLLEVVNSSPPVTFPERPATLPQQSGFCFENVSFRYNRQAGWTVCEIDLQLHPGRRIAVIGETGSGKSTLVHLLMRFRDPDAGIIRLGGVDIRNLAEPDLRRSMSIITQQPHMFNATLRENLLLARPGATDDQLLKALEGLDLLDYVKTLPHGLDTWIGETANRLSGGQARRVAVARAILHDAPLWVLDEPGEGLDPATEKKVMATVRKKTADRTLLLITHRLSDLYWMDHIVMMDRGRVVDQGSHRQLLARNARYASRHLRIGAYDRS